MRIKTVLGVVVPLAYCINVEQSNIKSKENAIVGAMYYQIPINRLKKV